jgi:hypothetical protein
MPDRCYLCGEELLDVPSGHDGPLLPKHRTRDHIPPQGLFTDPKPSNLIWVSNCNACNGGQSGFDERFRMLVASEISCNPAGKKTMMEKVLGSTMKKARQPKFVTSVVSTMRDVTLQTAAGKKEVSMFSTRSDEVFPGIIRITKGLLRHFYPSYDYRTNEFTVIDIHSATLLKDDWPLQLKIVRELKTKTPQDGRGNHEEFKFWHKVEATRGAWLLAFYDAIHFVVLHEPIGIRSPVAVSCST